MLNVRQQRFWSDLLLLGEFSQAKPSHFNRNPRDWEFLYADLGDRTRIKGEVTMDLVYKYGMTEVGTGKCLGAPC